MVDKFSPKETLFSQENRTETLGMTRKGNLLSKTRSGLSSAWDPLIASHINAEVSEYSHLSSIVVLASGELDSVVSLCEWRLLVIAVECYRHLQQNYSKRDQSRVLWNLQWYNLTSVMKCAERQLILREVQIEQ